jgi:hypothetical protein
MSGNTNNGLRQVLSELLTLCDQDINKVKKVYLFRGLQIEMKVTRPETYMRISRAGIYPSEQEWKTVLEHMPYPVMCKPNKFVFGSRHYLSGCWATQKRLFVDDEKVQERPALTE